jgi:hypothetical protein
MINSNAKKIALPLCLCAASVLFAPLASALPVAGTGDVAALRATEQKAALAKKAAEKEAKKAVTDVKKVTETPEVKPAAEAPTAPAAPAPAEAPKEK